MKRPILWLNLFFIAGIIGGQYISSEKGVALFSVVIIIMVYILHCKFKIYEPLIFIIITMIGFVSIGGAYNPKNKVIDSVAESEGYAETIGTIEDIGVTKTGNTKLTLVCNEIKTDKGNFLNENIKLRVIYVSDEEQSFKVGSLVKINGEINKFSKPSNPGGFNELLYMKTRGYDYNLYAKNIIDLKTYKNNINYKLFELRENINNVYDIVLPENEAGILKAMITGNRDFVSDYTEELFREAGISHIIAISGLHISILSLIIFKILKDVLNLNIRLCSFISIVLLLLYMIFTGCSASTVRAVIMCCVVLTGNIIFRDADVINSISIAMMIILIVQPLYLWDAGFQFSFITVTAVVCANKIFKSGLGISVVASVASYPLSAYYFYTIPLVGIVVNILILPFVSIVVGFGMIVGIVGLFSINGAVFLSGIVYAILNFYMWVCTYLTKIQFLQITIGRPLLITIILYYIMLITIYFYKEKSKKHKIFITLTAMTLFIILTYQRFISRDVNVCFLDVGQGDSAVISTYDKKVFVIDGGGLYNDEIGDSTGKNIVMPYINYIGNDEIDTLFISHFDSDHALGAIELLDLIKVNKVVISNVGSSENELYNQLISKVDKYKIPMYTMNKGKILVINENIFIECIYPFGEEKVKGADENSNSLVLRFVYNDIKFMFTGDIGINEEEFILNNESDLSADILKIAHHGSKFSSSERFLNSVGADIGIISSGENNIYGHPDIETLERLNENGIDYINTADCGGITIKTNGNKYEVIKTRGR